MKKIDIIVVMGGRKNIMDDEHMIISSRQTSDYYVAYGYTSGIAFCKKINGQKINLNLAITYDETSDETTVYLGVPLLNTDF